MTSIQKLVVLVVLMLVLMSGAASVSWQVQGWRMGKQLAEQNSLHQADLTSIGNAAVAQARAEQDKRLAIEHALAASDQKHAKELSYAQSNQAALRDRIATADVRLSVLLDTPGAGCGSGVPAATGTGGVVYAARRAQLDPAHAQRIIGITDDGDRKLIALQACQDYAKKISAGN
jgi:hypothetical protein